MTYKPHDLYFKKAKQEGYRSRAAYKLIELQNRFRLLKSGSRVIDLGAAPGGWLQVAAKIIGPSGILVGVDLQPIHPLPQSNVIALCGDIVSDEVHLRISQILGGPANCVLSDLAPQLSGIRDADMARSLELNRKALAVASKLLQPGGSLLLKGFISADLQRFTAELKQHFTAVRRTKPEATRHGSSEFYFYASGFVGRAAAYDAL